MTAARDLLYAVRPADAADDRTLLARFAGGGDEAAFAALVGRHGPFVLGLCRRTARDHHLAEDAFQATFLVLARRAAALRAGPSLAGWLHVVARRAAGKAAKRKSQVPGLTSQVGKPSFGLETWDVRLETADGDDLLRALDDELARLPDRLRGPLVACHLRGRTQAEAAREFGLSVRTLRRRLERGREVLRARLTARGATLLAGLAAIPQAATAAVPAALFHDTVSLATAARAGAAAAPAVERLAKEATMSAATRLVFVTAAGLAAAVGAVAALQPADPPKPAAGGPWVTLRGRVVWPKGKAVPAPGVIAVNVDKEHCLMKGPQRTEDLIIDPKSGGVKNVIVFLRPDDPDPNAKLPAGAIHPTLVQAKPAEHVVDQPCCQFVPRVLAVRAGDTVLFKNSSPVPHNVNFSTDTTAFNRLAAPGVQLTTDPLAAQSSPITFACNIHPWMAGRLMVFDHPYFAVTAADGTFEMRHAPAGKFRIVYRHEKGFHTGRTGRLGVPVAVADGGEGTMELRPVEIELP